VPVAKNATLFGAAFFRARFRGLRGQNRTSGRLPLRVAKPGPNT